MKSSVEDGKRLNPFAVRVLLGVFIPTVHAMWRPTIVGRENMPEDGPCFVYGNHSMYLDPFVVNIFFGMNPTAGIMAREFLRKGVKAWLLRNIGIVPVARNDASVIRAIFRMIEAKRKITIYPEGGRRWDGRPLPWIPSTVKLYRRTGLPVYCVIVHGSYLAWPRWATYPRPARLRLEFLPPTTVPKQESLEDATRRLQAPIDFDDGVADDAIKPKYAFRPAAGIHKLLYRDPVTGNSGEIYTPDGYQVKNREGSLNYTMLPDSTLRDEATGEIYTTGQLYERIRNLPPERDADGAYVSNTVDVKLSRTFPDFEDWGMHDARLFEDAIVLEGAERERWPLEEVQSAQIERNWKLQITYPEGILQLGFVEEGSALQWMDRLSALGIQQH